MTDCHASEPGPHGLAGNGRTYSFGLFWPTGERTEGPLFQEMRRTIPESEVEGRLLPNPIGHQHMGKAGKILKERFTHTDSLGVSFLKNKAFLLRQASAKMTLGVWRLCFSQEARKDGGNIPHSGSSTF